MNINDKIADKALNKLLTKKESIINSVLPEDIVIHDALEDLKFESPASDPDVQTLTYKGKPLITFYAPQYETKTVGDKVIMTVTQKYKTHE